jgi:hypothetical protein
MNYAQPTMRAYRRASGIGGNVASEPGGFLLTLITGAILMMLSESCGMLLQRFIPDPWKHGNAELASD